MKIAEEDIPVKKVFIRNSIGELFSPIFPTEWKEGEEKEETLFLLSNNSRFEQTGEYYIINYGFHSCSKIKFKAIGEFSYVLNKYDVVILTGSYANSIICDCVIPKGSYYFINEDEDYVSNKLKLVCVG
jgi:hypothetical protein